MPENEKICSTRNTNEPILNNIRERFWRFKGIFFPLSKNQIKKILIPINSYRQNFIWANSEQNQRTFYPQNPDFLASTDFFLIGNNETQNFSKFKEINSN